MFIEFASIKQSLFTERVNTWLGIVFLSTVTLWAALFVWDVTTGNNPIDRTIARAIDAQISAANN